ncbi:hypothetical protein [Psychroserpens sp. Hel_I_66]|uniref:hypothetical protein n=1 Tax=Psychroserpens sp. Hel_I_66 TaxID=1250004 RepID=UPI00064592BD|nr:hypothetical protein [Psychroserpens sp. Hel_I_66]
MRNYKTFEEIEFNLKRLNLERQIAFEELKGVKGDLKEDLQPAQWMQTFMKYATKLGSLFLFKKMIK